MQNNTHIKVTCLLITHKVGNTPGFLGIFDSCCGPLWLHLAGHKSYVVNGPVEAARLVICIMSSDIYSLQI